MSLPVELQRWREKIEGWARGYGLDFFDTIFEMVDWEQMNMIAAYGGFPTRYPHWRFGMEYEQLSKSYSYGLSKIYELVINTDPSYAYLLNANLMVDQKLVMAHVFGHVDFFKNNFWFSKTNRKMLDEMANHGARIRRFMHDHGHENVERFLDVCLSLDNLIDPHSIFIKRHADPADADISHDPRAAYKLKSKAYMEHFINPREFLDEMVEMDRKKRDEIEKTRRFPVEPQKDVLLFLLQHAPLAPWQQEVLAIIREEAYYFAPQGQTKIMNEGWASYWHTTIMTQKALEPSEIIDYADHHSGTVATSPGRINPYKIGLELFRHIEERWNKGQFGREWEECDDFRARQSWDRQLGLGRQKIFEVRKTHNDITFIDEFLTADFCREHKLFLWSANDKTGETYIQDRDFQAIKQQFLFMLTNHGQPHILVTDANHANRGELYLTHRHEGLDLKLDSAEKTLENVQAIWKRPVFLETVVNEKPSLLSFDGSSHDLQEI